MEAIEKGCDNMLVATADETGNWPNWRAADDKWVSFLMLTVCFPFMQSCDAWSCPRQREQDVCRKPSEGRAAQQDAAKLPSHCQTTQ